MRSCLVTVAITAIGALVAGCGGATVDTSTVQPDAGQLVRESGGGGAGGTGAADAGHRLVEAGADAPACGVIRASDYDQSCSAAQDCTAVFEGDTCTAQCDCPNATINVKALDGYHPVFPDGTVVCPCVLVGLPSCVHGVCTMCRLSGCPSEDGGLRD